ncbi:MAG: YceI family protein [Solirubrobacteraceae bacterium]
MAISPGVHKVGPSDGKMQVRTYREGMAQKIGHDLVLDVGQWQATVEVGPDGTPSAIELEADSSSLEVREGVGGAKPLSDKDRGDIKKSINDKVLQGEPIVFHSSAIEGSDGRLAVQGELEITGSKRPVKFDLDVAGDGRVSATLPLTQSEWGIKPYKAMMGALKVRDLIEVVLEVPLPTA